MDAKAPDVSTVIVSFNTRDYLAQCLGTIPQAAEGLAVEIIVVDNGSSDGTQAMLAERFHQVRLIQSQENLGFGRANNLGARAATGRTLLLLNSDCELQPGALKFMLDALDQDPSLGGVFCRLLNSDGSLQPSVHRAFPSPWSQVGDLFFLSSLRYTVYRNAALHPWLLRRSIRLHTLAQDVAWGGAACMLVRRDVFEAVGGFDERFFMYCEDLDLCKRIRDAGHRLRYLPAASAVHHWGKSAVPHSATMLREAYRSRMLYFEKHFPDWGGSVVRALSLGELAVRRTVFALAARIPSRHRQAFRDRASASAACLQVVRGGETSCAASAPAVGIGPVLPLLALVVLFSLFRFLHDQAKLLTESPFIDFAHYYTYAMIVAQGRNPFDPEAVAWADRLLNLRQAGASANYPPLFYLLMQPWILLPFRSAAVAWFLTSQVCLVATLGFCLRRFVSASPVRAAAALFVILNYQPLTESLALGQVNSVVLLLVTLAWWGLRSGHPWLAGGSVALSLHIKLQYALLLPLLWWMGQRRAAARGLLLAGLGVITGLLILGPAHHLGYLGYAWSPPDYLHAWTANLSPRATLLRLLGGAPEGRALANAASLALDGTLLYLFARAIRGPLSPSSHSLDWVWGLGLTAVPLLSPLTEEHHLVVLLLPLTLLLLAESPAPGGWLDETLLIASILLLGSRYSFERFPAFHQGPLSLLAAGKILGVSALAWVLMRRLKTVDRRTR